MKGTSQTHSSFPLHHFGLNSVVHRSWWTSCGHVKRSGGRHRKQRDLKRREETWTTKMTDGQEKRERRIQMSLPMYLECIVYNYIEEEEEGGGEGGWKVDWPTTELSCRSRPNSLTDDGIGNSKKDVNKHDSTLRDVIPPIPPFPGRSLHNDHAPSSERPSFPASFIISGHWRHHHHITHSYFFFFFFFFCKSHKKKKENFVFSSFFFDNFDKWPIRKEELSTCDESQLDFDPTM